MDGIIGICQHAHVPVREDLATGQRGLRIIFHPVDDHIAGARATLSNRHGCINAHVINVHFGRRGHVHVLNIRSSAVTFLQPIHVRTGIDETFRHRNSPQCGCIGHRKRQRICRGNNQPFIVRFDRNHCRGRFRCAFVPVQRHLIQHRIDVFMHHSGRRHAGKRPARFPGGHGAAQCKAEQPGIIIRLDRQLLIRVSALQHLRIADARHIFLPVGVRHTDIIGRNNATNADGFRKRYIAGNGFLAGIIFRGNRNAPQVFYAAVMRLRFVDFRTQVFRAGIHGHVAL